MPCWVLVPTGHYTGLTLSPGWVLGALSEGTCKDRMGSGGLTCSDGVETWKSRCRNCSKELGCGSEDRSQGFRSSTLF